MALVEGCKHELEFSIPAEVVAQEAERVAMSIQKDAKLPGFRPGKAPLSMIRSRYKDVIQQEILEQLIPRHFQKQLDEENLHFIGKPQMKDLHFHDGAPLRFKMEFEVAPEVELKEYREIPTPYAAPDVSDEDVSRRFDELRESRAEFINLDPRPAENGDAAVVDLVSSGGLEGAPMEAQDMTIELGAPGTMPEFSAVVGMSPGDVKTITVTYPEDYGQERLAGKTVDFQATLKRLQKKELPELNDDFAKDLGDFQSLDELRQMVRTNMLREREQAAQRAAKDAILHKLAEMHPFAVPETYVDRQIDIYAERFLAQAGADRDKIKIDRGKLKDAMRDQAIRDIRGTLVVDKIGTVESIAATKDEVDAELNRYARQVREPVAAIRKRFDENGTTGRIADSIRTEKIMSFLFEQARKEAPAEPAAGEAAAE
ncbi:MAG: trigger factor [Candidatus Solibacter usitatus]|nr:trigger factor [Candidatus Solibacter usitatus]